jgi:hypothetical protein
MLTSSVFWIGVVTGLFGGTMLSVFIMALMVAGKDDHDDYARRDDFTDLNEDNYAQQYSRKHHDAKENLFESRQ